MQRAHAGTHFRPVRTKDPDRCLETRRYNEERKFDRCTFLVGFTTFASFGSGVVMEFVQSVYLYYFSKTINVNIATTQH